MGREVLGPRIDKSHKEYDMSVRIGRGPRLRKMGRGALGPGMSRFDIETVSYFSKDLRQPQIRENGPGRLEPKDEQIFYIRIRIERPD